MNDRRDDSALLTKIRTEAKSMTEELGMPWDDIPAEIAEGACFTLLATIFEEVGKDCTAVEIAYHLGFLDETGELL